MKRWYAIHRWLGALAMVQLALWTVSGLFFAVAPLAEVRGEDRAAEPEDAPLDWEGVRPLPEEARAGAREVTLTRIDGEPVYRVRTADGRRLLHARSGERMTIGSERAQRIARADQRGAPEVAVATLIEASPPIEYRERPLPAWQVELADGRNTRIYVDAATGEVTARRNDLWRWFDFFWSLHIMDYDERDDFNHPLLIAFAGLGVVTVVSGGLLWILRLRRRWTRRRRAGAS